MTDTIQRRKIRETDFFDDEGHDDDEHAHLGWPGVPLYRPQKALCGAKLKGIPAEGRRAICKKCTEIFSNMGCMPGSLN